MLFEEAWRTETTSKLMRLLRNNSDCLICADFDNRLNFSMRLCVIEFSLQSFCIQKSRAKLERYLFYCNRYMNHLQSAKFEKKVCLIDLSYIVCCYFCLRKDDVLRFKIWPFFSICSLPINKTDVCIYFY